jgi:AraC-like DNA-binding protein
MMMRYIPHPPLSAYVSHLWFHQGISKPLSFERMLPDAVCHIIIKLGDDPFRVYNNSFTPTRSLPRALVAGPRIRTAVVDSVSQTMTIGVHFKPGGAYPFFQVPSDSLLETTVSLDTLWGSAADELRERLLEAPTLELKFSQLERFLISRLNSERALHPAVACALLAWQRKSTLKVSEQISASGFSARHFAHIFQQQVGLTPKRYSRLHRFHAALAQIRQGKQVDWAALALACGYFDQAHFINDFKAFSGLVPTRYVSQSPQDSIHVALPW